MIIAIAGGSGSGKTTVSKLMREKYKAQFQVNVEIISMDDYYKNIQKDSFENYDHPNAFNVDLLYSDLEIFNSTGTIEKRSYDYKTKQISVLYKALNVNIIILEGLYPYYNKKIKDLCSIKLFLDVNEETRMKQRLLRDLKERDIPIEDNMQMINGFVKEMYETYVTRQRRTADKIYSDIQSIISVIE